MDLRCAFPFLLLLGVLTAGGCSSSTEYLGQLDKSTADQTPAGGDSGASGVADSSTPSVVSSTECSQRGGACELDDGTALTDPCTGTDRPISTFACGAADGGTYFCCTPKVVAGGDTECAQHVGTCEFDDGTGLTDPCTATSRPIGTFACGAADGGTYFCCMPK